MIASMLDLREIIGSNKFIVVGDIHGCFDEFIELLNKCEYNQENDFVISVGDLVDRGPKSDQVLLWFKSNPKAFSVEGNHDNKAKRHWKGNTVKISNGLNETITQCNFLDTKDISSWIDTWPNIIKVPDINNKPTYVVHAGFDTRKPVEFQMPHTCMYIRFEEQSNSKKSYFGINDNVNEERKKWYESLDGSYTVLCGHIIHDEVNPNEHVFCLDAGAYKGKKLRALVCKNNGYKIVEVDSKFIYHPEKEEKHLSMDNNKEHINIRDQYVKEGILRKDELDNLVIYTYTDKCTFDKIWNDTTLNSRGIIFNRLTGEIVAFPFPKFFNIGEHVTTFENQLPWDGKYFVFEKLDGWLGTLYRHDNQYKIATKGSFSSPGALWATSFLNNKYDLVNLPDEVTLVFEIICPITKIIIDYENKEDLVLLTAFNRHTGHEYEWDQIRKWSDQFGFTLPKTYNFNFNECKDYLDNSQGKDFEGFVILFENKLRVKIKSKDYLRRAYIRSYLTPLSVWSSMTNGHINDEYIKYIDADYMPIFNGIHSGIKNKYTAVLNEINKEWGMLQRHDVKSMSRKDFAFIVQKNNIVHRSVMFNKYDNKNSRLDEYIMKRIRPHGNNITE